jgi:hypothetical protein
MSKLLIPAQFQGYSNRKDRSVVIRFETQEQTPQQIAQLHSMLDEFGALYFKGNEEITAAEREELDALESDLFDNPKTHSQRMRNVLYKLWKQTPEGFDEFSKYYSWRMNKVIEHFKAKLDPA